MTCYICGGQHFPTECYLAEADDFEETSCIDCGRCPMCEQLPDANGYCASCEENVADIAAFMAAAEERFAKFSAKLSELLPENAERWVA